MTYQFRLHVFKQECAAKSAIPIVSDMSAVHDLAEQVPQILPWHSWISF